MELKEFLETKLKKPLPSHLILHNMRLSDDSIRNSFFYNEPTYVPLYFWLGKILKPKTLLEIGFRYGLLSATFLKTCKTVTYFLALQEPREKYYSCRLGISNVKDHYRKKLEVYMGKLEDEFFEAKLKCSNLDLVIINEEAGYDRYRQYFDAIWPQLSPEGYMVVDCLKKYTSLDAAVKDFCISKNVAATYIGTTYGVSIIRKV